MKKILLLGVLTFIFKDIASYPDIQLVIQILEQTQKVQHLSFREGKRNRIVYQGELVGEPESLLQMLEESINERLKVEARPSDDGLEIILQPPPPSS
ncbi:MAG: hypothetical protein HY609_03800 [Deltaproteobacteria bacterium]|nr:hypothetical protein [Deltaproteobacteria bacterium]MBI4224032.1 hypothetical protein [Deltaproteobacteria bacterium]